MTNAKELKEQAYKKGVQYLGVCSDMAGVLVGNESFRTVIFNDRGEDGDTFVIIDDERKIEAGTIRCVSVLDGKFNIYDGDCNADSVAATLEGCYVVMTAGDVVLFQKVAR